MLTAPAPTTAAPAPDPVALRLALGAGCDMRAGACILADRLALTTPQTPRK